MSMAGIRNGAYHMLTASGPWLASEVSTCTFGILESVSGCAVVFTPQGRSPRQPLTWGDPTRVVAREQHIGGAVFIRFVADEKAMFGKVWQAYDDLDTTFAKDASLNDACKSAWIAAIGFDPDVAVEYGGAHWAVVEWELIAQEYDSG